ncbi:MAG: lipopolysaccharide transport periplasmic protein LptA [Halieaceae bacterium]|jgi:lipopolysaccharide export system protein LptA|nr:lipopolysaccharide transport periplasmic protein LptA [Halieaceae bacterium]
MFNPNPSIALFCVLGLCLSATTVSLPDDREQEIHITANKLMRNDKLGFTVYTGAVLMDQGSLHISADQITIYGAGKTVDRIIARGQPATLQEQPEANKGPVRARADMIHYYQREDRVHFKGNASIEQDGSTVSGETIDYFISQQLVKADSTQTTEGGRVQVVIPARPAQQTEEDSGSTDSE